MKSNSPLKILLHGDYGGSQFIRPLLSLGRELQRHHHQVMFAGSNYYFKDSNEFNISFWPLGSYKVDGPKYEVKFPSVIKDPYIIKYLGDVIPELYEHTLLRLKWVVNIQQPDVIICDSLAPACHDIAQLTQTPIINFLSNSDLNPNIELYKLPTSDPILHKLARRLKQRLYNKWGLMKLNLIRFKYEVPLSNEFLSVPTTLTLVNSFSGLELPVSIPNQYQLIGPILSETVSSLVSKWDTFLSHHYNIIYINFGAEIQLSSMLCELILSVMLEGIESNIIDGVIWNLGSTNISSFPEFIKRSPQFDIATAPLLQNFHPQILFNQDEINPILNHPNIKLFISNGELQSVFESILNGKRMILIPFMLDEPAIATKLSLMGVAYQFHPNKLTFINLLSTIQRSLYSNNDKLINLQQLALQSHQQSNAVNLIEQFVLSTQSCRLTHPPTFNTTTLPCESLPYQPPPVPSHFKPYLIIISILYVVVIQLFKFIDPVSYLKY